MPMQKIITLYTFDELSDEAKERAREWYRSASIMSGYWEEDILEDAKTIADLFGFGVDEIYYSGFWSQGDGASCIGRYRYKRGALKAVKKYAPNDEELHGIVQRLQKIQAANFYRIEVNVTHSGRYQHSGYMRFDIDRNDDVPLATEDKEDIKDNLRWFADWVYKRLENGYEWVNSDEVVNENILLNEYTFDEDGNREG